MKIETSLLIISFFVTLILGMIIIPILRKFKVGQIERDDGPKSHLKKQGTPTMGGIMMIISMIIVVTGAYIYLSIDNEGNLANNLLPILMLTIGFGIIGFIDDFKKLVLKNTKGLKPSYKMLGLLIISVAYVIYLVYGLHIGTDTYIPIMKEYVTMPIYVYIPFAILVILAIIKLNLLRTNYTVFSSKIFKAKSSTVVSSNITNPPSGPGSKCIPTLLPSLKLCPPKKFRTVSTSKPNSSAILCILPLGRASLIFRNSLNVIVLIFIKFFIVIKLINNSINLDKKSFINNKFLLFFYKFHHLLIISSK